MARIIRARTRSGLSWRRAAESGAAGPEPMSGENDRGAPKPGGNPFFEEGAAPAPRARPRRAKPPPGIITAGGVDMARGFAADIRVRDAPAPERPHDEPKVVVAINADVRKVPTHRSLIEGREPGEERAAMLPGV